MVVEVEGRRLKVGVPSGIIPAGQKAALSKAPRRSSSTSSVKQVALGRVCSPMQSTVVKINFKNGDPIMPGDVICIVEAMKMEQPIAAVVEGTIKEMAISEGDTVASGQVICIVEELGT